MLVVELGLYLDRPYLYYEDTLQVHTKESVADSLSPSYNESDPVSVLHNHRTSSVQSRL